MEVILSKIFSVGILNAMSHSQETREILRPYARQRRQSRFIRESILTFAGKMNFKQINIDKDRPEYIEPKMWQKIADAHKKSYIDYNYAVAFFWLLSLPQYEDYNRSKLMREIIVKSANHSCQ
jgi:hypothetical protein